jgi:hypothetical protein
MSGEKAVANNRNDDRKRSMNSTRQLISKALIAAAGLIAAASMAAPAAQAAFEITAFDGSLRANGEPSRQAGAHADFRTHFQFPTGPTGLGEGNPRDIRVDLPPGMTGNPTVAPECPVNKLAVAEGGTECPIDTAVGYAIINDGAFESYVYNVTHGADSPGLFGFVVLNVPVFVEPVVRPTDYGISALSVRTSEARTITAVDFEIWGVPFDHGTEAKERRPLMTNPTSCPGTAATFNTEVNSWQEPDLFHHASFNAEPDGNPFIFTGCDRLPFDPSVTAVPGTQRAHSPTGLDVDVKVPQNDGPEGFAAAHVKRTEITFPDGMSVSPSAVAGLGACSPDQIKLGTNTAPTCPDSSKIGTVSIETALLREPLDGEVILATQNNNPFNSLFAIYIVAKGPGIYLKLPGKLELNPETGQLKTIFDNTPQLPFTRLHLNLRGGPTAPLVTPPNCGTYQVHTVMTSWASPEPVAFDTPMVIDENCEGGGAFNPTLQAGVASPAAGANSPLTFRIRRQDGEQNLSRLEFTLPEGELAKLKGVEVCPESLAPSAGCGIKSQVGVSTTAIGTGAFPLFVPQPGKDPTALYLAGPYKGAPYSLITKVPAQSGPFDFGLIVVRTAINLDPITSQVIAKSDPLPQFLEGVPIQYRDVRIEVQKPDFTVNPTSCEQRYVNTTIISAQGAVAHPQTPFKVGDCASLNFGPKLAFKLKGGTHRGDFQALMATLTTGKHEANIARVAVTLPHSEFLEQGHIGTVCTRVQFAAKKCPDASIYGFAEAVTPLLDKPLSGPVYLRSSNHPLPDLVAALNGQFDIELAGRIDSQNGGIRNTFEAVPDAPVTKFVLKMKGGAKSLLVNSRNLCKSVARAEVKMIGQNGMRHNERPVVKNGCSAKAKKKAARGGHRKH